MTTQTTPPNVHIPAGAPPAAAPAPQPTQALTLAEKQSIVMGLETVPGFEAMQRCAMALASSDVVPETYQGKTGNCFVALDIALRLRMSPVLVMQNLYLVKGKASWSGKFQIAVINNSGLFTPLEWEWKGKQGQDDWGCRAFARRLRDGKMLFGTWIDVTMCKAEGWWNKPDRHGNESSKWQSMPEQMFMYRSASYWLAVHYPEGLAGLPTHEELEDRERFAAARDVTPPPAKRATIVDAVVAEQASKPEPAADDTLEPGKDPVSMQGELPAGATPFDRPGDPPVEAAPAPAAAPATKRRGLASVKDALKKAIPGALPAADAEKLAKQEAELAARRAQDVPAKEPAQEAASAPQDAPKDAPTPEAAPPASDARTAPPATSASTATALPDPTHEEMVAWCRTLPSAKPADVMRQFRVSFNRANVALVESRKK